jgi:hypothetical protein
MVHRGLKNRLRFKYIQQVIRLRGQLEEKYFDYNDVSPDSTDNPKKIFRLLRLQHRRPRLATLGGSPPRTRALSAMLGGSTSTRSGVRKIILKFCDFIDISNAMIPTALGGSTTTSPPIVIVILR